MITSTREPGWSAVSSPASLAVDVDVDVLPNPVARGADAVAEGPALLEPVEHLVDGRGLELEPARQAGEERRQRRGDVNVGHGYSRTATSTDAMPGR